mmetsp:Transcript_47294/g.52885  ORF Transcript_47294/g.52885 Transcript_47294/m.52885 type:complete len:171 (+) Transcript_47294:81-593(+)
MSGIKLHSAAVRHLCQHGENALKAQKVVQKATTSFNNYVAKPSREVWKRPLISKRVANVVRKQSIQDGTYGTFNAMTGIGWDKSWDYLLFSNRYEVSRFGGMKPSKQTKRARTREDRALKLENELESVDSVIEQYYTDREESKIQDKSFEARVKRMAKSSGGSGGGAPNK